MSNGKGSGRRPAAITRAEFDAAWERNFGVKQPPREMADPVTCEHRNKQLIGGALDGSWDKYGCADCGASFKERIATLDLRAGVECTCYWYPQHMQRSLDCPVHRERTMEEIRNGAGA